MEYSYSEWKDRRSLMGGLIGALGCELGHGI